MKFIYIICILCILGNCKSAEHRSIKSNEEIYSYDNKNNLNHGVVDTCLTPDKEPGECKLIKECQSVSDFIKSYPRQIPPEVSNHLRQYTCGYGIRDIKVCCPVKSISFHLNDPECIPVKQCPFILDLIQSSPSPIPPDIKAKIQSYTCTRYGSETKVRCPKIESNCIPIKQCKSIIDYISSNSLTPEVKKELQKYTCGNENASIKVNCPQNLKFVISREPTINEAVEDYVLNSDDCINIKECKSIMDFMATRPNPLPKEDKIKLQKYSCGYEGSNLKVNCPSTFSTTSPPNVSKHRNIHLLPLNNCGLSQIDDDLFRILNGEEALLFEFPWMALISYKKTNGYINFKCGATVINNKYVLTASHCISDHVLKKSDLTIAGVRIGEYDISTNNDCDNSTKTCSPPVQDFFVEKVILHPNYNTENHQNDIGLLRIRGSINFSLRNMKPVCLPILESETNYEFGNTTAVATGWGATEKFVSSSILLKVHLVVVPQETCRQIYKNLTNLNLLDQQLCAGGNSHDTCKGDSGGPLYQLNGSKYIQQGIVSLGPKLCGAQNFPGVYTRVAYYMDWILDSLEP